MATFGKFHLGLLGLPPGFAIRSTQISSLVCNTQPQSVFSGLLPVFRLQAEVVGRSCLPLSPWSYLPPIFIFCSQAYEYWRPHQSRQRSDPWPLLRLMFEAPSCASRCLGAWLPTACEGSTAQSTASCDIILDAGYSDRTAQTNPGR